MKKIITLIIAISLTLSCGEEVKTSTVQELNSQKSELVKRIDSMNNELRVLEGKISKLEPKRNLQIVTKVPVVNGLFKHYIEIQGVVKADKNIEIRPELGGTVMAIYVKEGQKVNTGQVLIQLDDEAIVNGINEIKTQLELAKTTFERQERLWNQKIGSEMQYLQAKAQKETLENSLKTINTQASKMKIKAPFSGIVDMIYPKKGELTSPQMPVIRLLNLDKVYVEADVTETYLPVVEVGTETILNFESIHKEVQASISQKGNYINPDNRSFRARIDIPNKDQSIKPNLLADLKILDFQKEGIIIPSHLVQQDQTGNDYVFTIENRGNDFFVVKKMISVLKEYNNQVFVSEGLSAEDILINAGARLVKNDDEVHIRQE